MDFKLDKHYSPGQQSNWQGRPDSEPNERFFQIVTCIDLNKDAIPDNDNTVVLLGFASDEGVRRNHGRPGAKEGPDVIRQQLANLSLHRELHLIDIGNITCLDGKLEDAQQALSHLISTLHEKQLPTLIFGGGHEIAYGHFLGIKPHYNNIGIINFDAHFDLRESSQASSGTPFLQIAKTLEDSNEPFNYCCLGVQPRANTKHLFDTAESLNVSYLKAHDIHQQTLSWQQAFLDDFIMGVDNIYLSVCMDVFAQAFAPGVSAPQPLGLNPTNVNPLLDYIMQSGKVVSVDIAETCPPMDRDNQTSKLASLLAAQLL